MKKTILSLGLFLLLFGTSQAQIGVQLAQFRPVGEMGMIFKRQIGVGISWNNEFDEGSRTGLSFAFFKLNQRIDPFPVVGTITGGNGTFVSLGTQTFTKYNVAFIDAYYDKSLISREKIDVFLGGGVCIGGAAVDYEAYYPKIESTSYSGGGVIGGLFLRAGVEYRPTDTFSISLLGSRRIYFQEESGIFGAYMLNLGGTYWFE
jgi:hypothetical protein